MKPGLHRLSVLIVDDNSHMISIVRTMLLGFGITKTWESRDAAEALEIVRHEPVDIVITDYQMPLLDGLEFTRLVRTGDDIANPFIPIILLTAHTERSRVIAARDAGVTEVCAKPINAKEIWTKIAAVVNQPRPFIRARQYSGPDRRRRTEPYKGEDRRAPAGASAPDEAQE
ncbi:response regulator [Alkalicaulis satelles]|uniref:Response regulator n=1 Tax=Alkalicaulis satelles TaxID=2609175 RepID=A0A5M6ZMA7_9PROT|nr:response regulator [Alkalicaulis satelles]KAA5804827.1 response regulator [Alkalicaulis satelles]